MYLASELCQAEAEIIYKSLKNGLEMTLTSALNLKIPANFAGRWDVDIFCDSPSKQNKYEATGISLWMKSQIF